MPRAGRRFAYDEYNRQVKRTLPGGAFETTGYNDLGQLSQKIDFTTQKIVYVYQANLNRVQRKDLYAVGASAPSEHVDYGYDPLGRIQTVTQVRGPSDMRQTVYGYDPDSRIINVATPEGTLNYGYEPATGRHIETKTFKPDLVSVNTDVTYGYDLFGQLKTVSVTARDGNPVSGDVTTYNWNPVGTLHDVQHPTGVDSVYGYDDRHRVTSVVHNLGAGQVASYFYDRQADGKITHVNEFGTDPTTRAVALDYLYDELGRLTHECTNAASHDACRTMPADHTDYSLDLVGNRLQKQTVNGSQTQTTTWHYNARDEIIDQIFGSQTTSFGYDANGSLTSRNTTATGETIGYDYNLENRLSAVHITRTGPPNTQIDASYLYNDSALRVQERTTTRVGSGDPTTDVKQLLRDDNNPTGYSQVMEERNNDPQLTLRATYVYGLEPLEESQVIQGQPNIYHYLTDVHSGVRILTDGTGTQVASYRYDAFGTLLGSSGNVANPLLYRGERLEPVTGFYDFRQRPTYDPSLGRSGQTDPLRGHIAQPETLHKYVYASADPINNVDPSGEESLGSLLTGISIRITLFTINHPVLAGALGFVIDALLPAQFHEAMIGSGIPPFQLAGNTGRTGRGFLRTIFAAKSPWFSKIAHRWNNSALGTLTRGVGRAFEDFFFAYMPDALRNVETRSGITKHTIDYVWRGWVIEIKTGVRSIDQKQLEAAASYAAENNLTLVYYFLEKPANAVINKVHAVGGHVVYLFEQRPR